MVSSETLDHINRLQRSQNVGFLPTVYRDYMLEQGLRRRMNGELTLKGSYNLGWVLKGALFEDFSVGSPSGRRPSNDQALLGQLVTMLAEDLFGKEEKPTPPCENPTKLEFIKALDDGMSYPQDAFVFFFSPFNNYFFFRTEPPDDDPPVYAYERTRCFFKLADSFAEFLDLCAQGEATSKPIWDQRHQTAYYFDQNAFHRLPPVDFSLLPERLLHTLRARVPDKVIRFRGCSEVELEALRAAQQVNRLPDTYQRVMRVMGKWGLGALLCGGYADVSDKLDEKRSYYTRDFDEDGLAYPSDLFIFWGDSQGCGCNFFRTSPDNDDPPVYVYWQSGVFHKAADSFTEYLLWEIQRDYEEPVLFVETYYHYDPDQDDFVISPSR